MGSANEPAAGWVAAGGPAGDGAPPTIAPVDRADVPAIAALYARVFSGNPAYSAIFACLPDERRSRALLWFFACRLRAFMAAGGVFLAARRGRGGEVLGAGGLVPPGASPSVGAMLWHGMAPWPLYWGVRSLRTALAIDARMSAGHSGGGASGGVAQISMLAVAPEARRRGVARALLARLLDAATERGDVRRISLATQDTGAVALYERHGFGVVAKELVELPVGAAPFASWAMALALPPSPRHGPERDGPRCAP